MNSTTHYSDLGLVNTKDMFQRALEGKYEELIKMVKLKNETVLGSAGRA
jgi:hypothetical protein